MYYYVAGRGRAWVQKPHPLRMPHPLYSNRSTPYKDVVASRNNAI